MQKTNVRPETIGMSVADLILSIKYIVSLQSQERSARWPLAIASCQKAMVSSSLRPAKFGLSEYLCTAKNRRPHVQNLGLKKNRFGEI